MPLSITDGSPPTVLRICENPDCRRVPDGKMLRKCGRCSGALYCSKECQKASWPAHKICCQRYLEKADALTDLNRETRPFGYDSTVALNTAMHEYTEAHQWAIHSTILVHILLRSGPSMAVAQQEPLEDVLRFRLVCQSTPGTPRSHRNPATTFRVIEHGFCPLAPYNDGPPQNRQLCAEMLADLKTYHEGILRTNNPHYVGVLPIMYFVQDVSILQFSLFPVFRPPTDFPMGRGMKAVLGALMRYSSYTMGTPFPLRAADERLPCYAVPGRFSREKGKQWTWEALFDDWDEYNAGRAGCGRLPGIEELQLELPPSALMDFYSMLWGTDTAIIERFALCSS